MILSAADGGLETPLPRPGFVRARDIGLGVARLARGASPAMWYFGLLARYAPARPLTLPDVRRLPALASGVQEVRHGGQGAPARRFEEWEEKCPVGMFDTAPRKIKKRQTNTEKTNTETKNTQKQYHVRMILLV